MSNDKPLSEILNELFNQKPFKQKIRLQKIENIWRAEMGETIMRYTDQLYLRKSTLVINVSSSVMRHQLTLGKDKIINKLNTALGEDFIMDILIF